MSPLVGQLAVLPWVSIRLGAFRPSGKGRAPKRIDTRLLPLAKESVIWFGRTTHFSKNSQICHLTVANFHDTIGTISCATDCAKFYHKGGNFMNTGHTTAVSRRQFLKALGVGAATAVLAACAPATAPQQSAGGQAQANAPAA